MRGLEVRIEKLEAARGAREVVIWCDEESEMGLRAAEMIAAGTLKAADRLVCVHWSRASAAPGEHERCLAELN